MKFIKLLLLLHLSFLTAWSIDYSPWLTPPFEFQGRLGSAYKHSPFVQSPLGSFSEATHNFSTSFGLGLTPWPSWNVEADILFTQTQDISFTYESIWLIGRYAWLDDVAGDYLSCVTGATLSFPGHRFLHQLSLPYHGQANVELHLTLGKEWRLRCHPSIRLWGLAGFGIAERGSPWIHTLGTLEYLPFPHMACALYTEALYGLGKNNIIPFVPFPGYASIHHQNIDFGGYINYEIRYWGELRVLGWTTLHAHNFIADTWGVNISLLIPFSVI
jgi:hypothetical protein